MLAAIAMKAAGCFPPTVVRASVRGFTLIEFLITLVIAGILATLAAPSFVQYLASARIRNASYDLTSALQIARSEAIKRNTAIEVVAGTNWTSGWTVQVPITATVLRQQDRYQGLTITNVNPATFVPTITYGNDGRATTAATTFKVQPSPSVSGITARCVIISLSGVATSKVGGC